MIRQCFSNLPDHETYLGVLVLKYGFPGLEVLTPEVWDGAQECILLKAPG